MAPCEDARMTVGDQHAAEADTENQGLSGIAVAALVLGIVGLLLTVTVEARYAPFAFIASAAAITLGIAGGAIATRQHLAGVWLARVGIVLGVLAAIIGAFWFNQ
jgi:energy-converting hydrogenase Eha subunit A